MSYLDDPPAAFSYEGQNEVNEENDQGNGPVIFETNQYRPQKKQKSGEAMKFLQKIGLDRQELNWNKHITPNTKIIDLSIFTIEDLIKIGLTTIEMKKYEKALKQYKITLNNNENETKNDSKNEAKIVVVTEKEHKLHKILQENINETKNITKELTNKMLDISDLFDNEIKKMNKEFKNLEEILKLKKEELTNKLNEIKLHNNTILTNKINELTNKSNKLTQNEIEYKKMLQNNKEKRDIFLQNCNNKYQYFNQEITLNHATFIHDNEKLNLIVEDIKNFGEIINKECLIYKSKLNKDKIKEEKTDCNIDIHYNIINETSNNYPGSRQILNSNSKQADLAWHQQWKGTYALIDNYYTLKTDKENNGTCCIDKVIQIKNVSKYAWEFYIEKINKEKRSINMGFIKVEYGFIGWYPKQNKWDQTMIVSGYSCYLKIVEGNRFINLKVGKNIKDNINICWKNDLVKLPKNDKVKDGDRFGFMIDCKQKICMLYYNSIWIGKIFDNIPDYIVPAIDYNQSENIILARNCL